MTKHMSDGYTGEYWIDGGRGDLTPAQPVAAGNRQHSSRRGWIAFGLGLAVVTALITGRAMADPRDPMDCPGKYMPVETSQDTPEALANELNPGGLNNAQLKMIVDLINKQEQPLHIGDRVKVLYADQCH